jgi:hypothetical protein
MALLHYSISHRKKERAMNCSGGRLTVVVLSVVGSLLAQAGIAQNVLVNGDFETVFTSSPPLQFANNIGYPITPWVLGPGEQANVVEVNGGAKLYANGPQSDASGKGKLQHYLDIAGGKNDFYQSFTPRCSGQVRFGGSFSSRDDRSGEARVTIRRGVGTAGEIVGTTNVVPIPVVNSSRTDPWKTVSYTAPVTAGETYSFIVFMNDYSNFDNGFVEFLEECGTAVADPCCPPWNADTLLHQLKLTQTGSVVGPIAYSFVNSAPYKDKMQAYIDYLHSVNPSIKDVILYWSIEDRGPSGPGTSPSATGTPVGPAEFTAWSCGTTSSNASPCQGVISAGGSGNLTNGNGSNVFNPSAHPLVIKRWYRISTFIYLNDNNTFWPVDQCSYASVDLTVYAGPTGKQHEISVEYRQPGATAGQTLGLPFERE